MRRIWLVVVPVALLALTGCPSLSTMQTPSTVPKGQIRFGVGLEGVGFAEADGSSVTVPQNEISVRYGASDDIDLGAKLYFLGMEVGAKYQFLRGVLDAAFAPAVSYISISAGGGSDDASASVAYIHVPLLLGYNVSDRLTFGFGPKLMYTIATGSASSDENESSVTATGLMTGGYAQIAFRLGDAFWIAPEINVYKPFAEGAEGVVYQGGLVFLFGGAPRTEPAGQPVGQPMGQPVPPPMGGPPGGP
jgi:hypothetical protein